MLNGPIPPLLKAVFFDRDGVLNVDTGYASDPAELILTRTAADAVLKVNRAGALAIVVTNQSAVARGFCTLADVNVFNQALQDELAKVGARIDAFYVCPYHPEGSVPEFTVDHDDRKPRPGMLLRAIAQWSIDPSTAVFIGDKDSDMEAARTAGIRGIHVPRDVENLAAIVGKLLA